jgi:hypothetical protein
MGGGLRCPITSSWEVTCLQVLMIVMVENNYCHFGIKLCMLRGTGIRLVSKAKIISRLQLKLINNSM